MPHAHSSSAASSGGDDLGSTDEVKVFKDEGDGEDEKRSSENLLEEKSSLIDWTESEEKSGEPYSGKLSVKSDLSPVFDLISTSSFGSDQSILDSTLLEDINRSTLPDHDPTTIINEFKTKLKILENELQCARQEIINLNLEIAHLRHINTEQNKIIVKLRKDSPCEDIPCGDNPSEAILCEDTPSVDTPQDNHSQENQSQDNPTEDNPSEDRPSSPGKFEPHPAASFNMGYLMAPYTYPNGGAHPLPVSMAGKMGLPAGGGLSLFCPGGDLGQPPPAHMGIPPPYQLDSKLAAGLARTPMYPFPGGAYPYPMLSPEMSQVAASWHTPSMYPITSAASGFRSPYPTSLPISTSSLSSELYRFSPTLGGGLGLGLGPALVPPPPSKTDLFTHHSRSQEKGNSSNASDKAESANNNSKEQNKKPHIKKPLNAFMLYMKEMRAKVVAECTLKESAAINQILGRRWHALGREEQAKYYELARRERQLHMQLYPDWSSRANTQRGKKRKRKQETTDGGNNLKKCRARYGLDQQNQWCKPCRRKKKCVRYMEALAAATGGTVALPMATPQSPCSEEDVKLEDMSDASSDEADTPLNSASSPGGLSALSSLASPASDPPPPPRNPVGTNPRDANNPLSVGQLTSQSWPRAAQARPGHEVISVS